MKLLILILLSSSTFAGNYIPKSKVGDCTQKTVYTAPQGADDILVPVGYNCNTHIIVDEMIDDITKPVNSKSETQVCADQASCEALNSTKTCIDPLEKVIMAADFSEIYCSKFLHFAKKLSGRKIVVEDATKKAAFDAAEAIKKAQADALSTRLKDMAFGKDLYASIQLLNISRGLTKAQRRQIRADFGTMREDLYDGNICDMRVDLVALVPDGVLIRAADKTSILAKIDAYKTCP